MADRLSPERRSANMARIRGRNTTPELLLRRALWRAGARYRLNTKVRGKPDLIFPRQQVAVFVDGCFWHGCPDHYRAPANNEDFWRTKLEQNLARDRVVNAHLEASGWTVLRFWEHEIKVSLPDVTGLIMSTVRSQLSPRKAP